MTRSCAEVDVMPWQPDSPATANSIAAKKARRRSGRRPALGLPGLGVDAMKRVRESLELTGCTEFAYLLTLSDLRALRGLGGVQNRGSAKEGKLGAEDQRGCRQAGWTGRKKSAPNAMALWDIAHGASSLSFAAPPILRRLRGVSSIAKLVGVDYLATRWATMSSETRS